MATFLAKISYTLYATHFPVLAFIWFVVFAPNKYVFGQAALGLCGFLLVSAMLVATGMWWLFERNTERVRNVLETLLLGSEDGGIDKCAASACARSKASSASRSRSCNS